MTKSIHIKNDVHKLLKYISIEQEKSITEIVDDILTRALKIVREE